MLTSHPTDRQRQIHLHPSLGFTFLELLAIVTVIGVLSALAAPSLVGTNRPLQNGVDQAGGLFQRVRLRAVATSTAYRIRPDISSVIGGNRATRFQVQSANNRNCNATTVLTTDVPAGTTTLPVNSTNGFGVNDRISIGAGGETYDVISVNTAAFTITIGTALNGAASANDQVETVTQWESGDLVTSLTPEELTVPQPTDMFGRAQQNSGEQIAFSTLATVGAAQIPWAMCFNSRGIVNVFNGRTGQPVNGNLELRLDRLLNGTAVANSTVTVLRGGTVVMPPRVNQ